MTTFPLQWPNDVKLSSIKVLASNITAHTGSPFTFQEKVYEFPGERWEVTGSLPLMDRATIESYFSFVLALRQRVGTFIFALPSSGFVRRGAVFGTPVVDGAGQATRMLASVVQGFTASAQV